MKVNEAYTDWSTTYDSDRNRTRDLDQAVAQRELGELHCRAILEIGCGTGKNTQLLAEIGAQVLALDFSPGMIEKAKTKVDRANVTFELADINQGWPCKDRSFDLISCNLVLEHIEQLSFVFAEAARVLVEGGRFFVCELHPFRQYQGTQAQFQRAEVTTHISAFVHHTSDFTKAAGANGLTLVNLREWWHADDEGKPPRLISFLFKKGA